MKVLESAENYLETILILGKKGEGVRSIDIANQLGFSKPSVSIAMKNLREHKYISVDDDGFIVLSPQGREIAEKIFERHTIISQWLEFLGVNPTTAVDDACRIEHVISAETFDAIKAHIAQHNEHL